MYFYAFSVKIQMLYSCMYFLDLYRFCLATSGAMCFSCVGSCRRIFNYIGNCAQNVRIFACKIKVHLFIPQEWGNEGVEVLKHFFILVG